VRQQKSGLEKGSAHSPKTFMSSGFFLGKFSTLDWGLWLDVRWTNAIFINGGEVGAPAYSGKFRRCAATVKPEYHHIIHSTFLRAKDRMLLLVLHKGYFLSRSKRDFRFFIHSLTKVLGAIQLTNVFFFIRVGVNWQPLPKRGFRSL